METTALTTSVAKASPLVLVSGQNGITVIPTPTPLTRLNYFDGKFLRASDLSAEQRYLRSLVEYSNRAGGHGVAYGYDVTQSGQGGLGIGPGLAIDPEGRVLLLPTAAAVDFQELIDKSRQGLALHGGIKPVNGSSFAECVMASETPPVAVVESGDLFVITIAQAEALCGEEDVYGKLCEEACVTSTDRPYRLEGVIIRARPLQLLVPLPVSAAVPLNQTHLRSRAASSYFETERRRVASHISKAGLESEMWCLGAQADSGSEVPIAVVARGGGGILFLDPWIVRRERIDPPAKRYWQWRMSMRPWDVFLAQILQFQCQLHECLKHHGPNGEPDDPCKDEKKLVSEAADTIVEVTRFYEKVAEKLAKIEAVTLLPGGLSGLRAIQTRLLDAKLLFALPAQDRRLIRCGIIELPSAGYLPVAPGSVVSVNRQVRQMMGEGVDLRFCIVRPDYVAHALEEAQHMERISLVEGLDHPDAKPQVDILVPNGEILKQLQRSLGTGFEALVQFGTGNTEDVRTNGPAAINLQGAARAAALETGGGAIYLAAVTQTEKAEQVVNLVSGLAGIGKATNVHLNKLRNLSEETEPAPLGTIAANPRLFTRLNTVAAEALRFNAARRAAAQPFLTMARAAAEPLVFTPTHPTDDRLAALWLGANIARNPFVMAAGETTPVELRFVLVMPSEKPTIIDLQVRGEWRLEQTVLTGGGRKITGTVPCLISLTRNEAGAAPKPVHSSAKLKGTAFLNAAGTIVEIELTDPESTVQFKVKSELAGDPVKVRTQVLYSVRRGEESVEIQLADSLLAENAAVLEVGNTFHTAALSALEVVEAALNDADFADINARLLFPPPPPPVDELLVRATLDWVLFHRRRTKTCTSVTEPVVAATRRYQVYHLLAPDVEHVEAIRDALLNNKTAFLAKAGFQSIDTVEFSAGLATLLTPVADVQTDWQTAQPGATLIYGAVASQGAALQDGNTLALSRLSKLQQAVAPISAPDPKLTNEVVSTVPAPLSTPGTDGSMILITLTANTCHSVFRTVLPLERVLKVVKGPGMAQALNQQMIAQLTDVEFKAGTADIQGDGAERLKKAWTAQGGGSLVAGAVVFRDGDQSVASALRKAQGQALQKLLGEAPLPDAVPISTELGVDCTTVTILEAKALRIGRIYVQTDTAGDARFLPPLPRALIASFNADGALAGELPVDDIRAAFQAFPNGVRQVDFAPAEGANQAGAATRLKSTIKALKDAHLASATVEARVVDVTPTEQPLLTADGVEAEDLIFLMVSVMV